MKGSIIEIDLKKGSKYEKEIDESAKVFYSRGLDFFAKELLKERGFEEQAMIAS